MRPPIDNGTILITGASSGIGAEFARILASRAKRLILVARRKNRLEELKEELQEKNKALEIQLVPCDLTDRAAVDDMLAKVEEESGFVDILINNAGMGSLGSYDLCDWSKIDKMLLLNINSLMYLTHKLLQPMVKNGKGGVLNISSGFGLTWLPGFGAYVGTKHFVTSFTECLRLELVGTGVVVSQVCPGPVATEFENAMGNFTDLKAPKIVEISAKQCAKESIQGFARGKAMIVPGFIFRKVMFFSLLAPRWLTRWFVKGGAKILRKKQLDHLSSKNK